MRSTILKAMLLAATLGAGCAATVSADAYGPDLVTVSPGVQVIADYDEPIFYSDGFYWRFYGGGWYRSTYYTGGWVYARPPVAVLRVDRPYGVRALSSGGLGGTPAHRARARGAWLARFAAAGAGAIRLAGRSAARCRPTRLARLITARGWSTRLARQRARAPADRRHRRDLRRRLRVPGPARTRAATAGADLHDVTANLPVRGQVVVDIASCPG